jgi:hypothetical protein
VFLLGSHCDREKQIMFDFSVSGCLFTLAGYCHFVLNCDAHQLCCRGNAYLQVGVHFLLSLMEAKNLS